MKVTVMGLGLFGGGVGAARHFAERGEQVSVTDLRSADELKPALAELEGLEVDCHLGGHPEDLFREADLVVVNPAVKPDQPLLKLAAKSGARLTTEVNLVFELSAAPVAAVTGSNGKSTVAAMLAAALEADGRRVLLGGNLGGSLLGNAADFDAEGIIVLELSSFQLERLAWTGRSPHLAVATNITPNHLDWHRDLAAYARAKEQIARFQSADDLLVLNADCPAVSEWAGWAAARAARFSLAKKPPPPAAWLEGEELLLDAGDGRAVLMPAAEINLPGRHNLANALAAALGAALLGARPESAAAALRAFRGLPHRLELVAERGGVRYYNDSIATTPEAAIAALRSFDCPLALIAGGSDKGLDFAEFGRAAAGKAEIVVLTGGTAPAIRAAVESAGGGPPVLAAGSLDEAFGLAAENARPGWAVLLSPASASFDQFPNFTARGDRFRRLVGELPG